MKDAIIIWLGGYTKKQYDKRENELVLANSKLRWRVKLMLEERAHRLPKRLRR